MKFAFLVMGDFNTVQDRAAIHGGMAQIIGVSDIAEACRVVKELYENGVGCIELCGAFGEAGAKAVVDATQNKVPIGYITHLPEQDAVYREVFPEG